VTVLDHLRQSRVGRLFLSLLALVGMLAYLGGGVTSIVSVPGYAVVYLDDVHKTYLSLPCLDDWKRRPTQTIDTLRQALRRDAYKLGYQMDEDCRNAGGFSEDDRSAAGLVLEKLGILSPLEHWWDRPYRTEDGRVVLRPAELDSN
jgi:hypothetical protein